jgi:hypothetical protein
VPKGVVKFLDDVINMFLCLLFECYADNTERLIDRKVTHFGDRVSFVFVI